MPSSPQPMLRAIAAFAVALGVTGCGRATSLTGVSPPKPGAVQRIGIPGNYAPGQAVPGAVGTPSLRAVNWPRMSRTAKGVDSDPVNVIIGGTEHQVRHCFGARGWVEADPTNAWTAAKTIKTALLGGEYPTSPMSDLLLYNRKQDIALQKNQVGTRARDHLRVWKTPLLDHQGRPIWAIAATKDVAIKLAPGERLPTHQISPDIDAERALVVDDFHRAGQVAQRYQLQSLPTNFRGVNGGGDEYFTDGKVEVLELRKMNAPAK